MKQQVLIGQTDYTVLVKIRDDAGAPATGLVYTDIDIAYARVETDNDVTTSDVSPATLSALTDAHSDWGFKEVSATDHPGVYRLDIADAVFASGAWSAVVSITGTGLDPADLEFMLVGFNQQDSVRLGLTALPNAAAEASGGLVTRGTGTGQISVSSGAVIIQSGTGTGQVSLSSGAVLVQYGTSTGQINLTGGKLTASTFAAGTIDAAAIADGAIDAATFASGAINAAALAADAGTEIADAVLSRNVSNVEGSAPTNASLCFAILAMRHVSLTANPGYITVYQTDGTTEFVQIAVATDAAAEPVTDYGV